MICRIASRNPRTKRVLIWGFDLSDCGSPAAHGERGFSQRACTSTVLWSIEEEDDVCVRREFGCRSVCNTVYRI